MMKFQNGYSSKQEHSITFWNDIDLVLGIFMDTGPVVCIWGWATSASQMYSRLIDWWIAEPDSLVT